MICGRLLILLNTPFVLLLVVFLLAVSLIEINPGISISPSRFRYGVSAEADFMGLLILALLYFILMLIISVRFYQNHLGLGLQVSLTLVLTLVFLVKNLLWFYILFEVSLIPIGFIILIIGYQPERIQAISYIFMYTIVASMPLLLLILGLGHMCTFRVSTLKWTSLDATHHFQGFVFMFIMLAFMVKLPVYGLHMWLPKAHVEAPLEGSIILAGLLLKVGGFGIVLFLPVSNLLSRNLSILVSFCRGLGGVLIRILCLRIIDLKIIIAYSSVSHMSICLMCVFASSKIGVIRGILVILAHGISSPAIFTGAFNMYTCRKSRNLMLNRGGLRYAPTFRMWWFLACLANMAAPPTLNLVREVLSFISLWWLTPFFSLQMGIIIFLRGAYRLVAYSFTQHRFRECSNIKIKEFSITTNLVIRSFSLPLLLSPIYLSRVVPVSLMY